MTLETRIDAAQFDTWVQTQFDRSYELIAGRVVEVVSNSPASRIAFRIGGFLFVYLEKHPIGAATGADGGYVIGTERYIPDVGFIRHEHQVMDEGTGYYPVAPDLAVEVISNPRNLQELNDLRVKIANYVAAGTLVWVVDPIENKVEVYQGTQPARIYAGDDILTAPDILPGFELKISDIFPKA